jgi:hypothetical protein
MSYILAHHLNLIPAFQMVTIGGPNSKFSDKNLTSSLSAVYTVDQSPSASVTKSETELIIVNGFLSF